jgi:hypothetical protein
MWPTDGHTFLAMPWLPQLGHACAGRAFGINARATHSLTHRRGFQIKLQICPFATLIALVIEVMATQTSDVEYLFAQ